MRYRRSRKRRIDASRVTDAQRTATEQAFLDSFQHPTPSVIPIYNDPPPKRQAGKRPIARHTYQPSSMVAPRPYVTTAKDRRESASGALLGCLIVSIIIVAVMLIGLYTLPPSAPSPTDTTPYTMPTTTTDTTSPFCSTQTCISNFPNGTGSLI